MAVRQTARTARPGGLHARLCPVFNASKIEMFRTEAVLTSPLCGGGSEGRGSAGTYLRCGGK